MSASQVEHIFAGENVSIFMINIMLYANYYNLVNLFNARCAVKLVRAFLILPYMTILN